MTKVFFSQHHYLVQNCRIFNPTCLRVYIINVNRLQLPNPHNCTSSIWDEIVFILVTKFSVVKEVESKFSFAYPLTLKFFLYVHTYLVHPFIVSFSLNVSKP